MVTTTRSRANADTVRELYHTPGRPVKALCTNKKKPAKSPAFYLPTPSRTPKMSWRATPTVEI